MSHDDNDDVSQMSVAFSIPSLSVQTATLSSCDPPGVCAHFGRAIGICRHDGVASCLLDEKSVRANHVRRVLNAWALLKTEASYD